MRELTDHKLNGLNDAIRITVVDEPGSGGACHEYNLDLLSANGEMRPDGLSRRISFQNGPIKEAGFNGWSGEALLAINIDRMRGFQSGPYASEDNANALHHMEQALYWLQKRTRDRIARNVEGTHTV